jgi:hypothetical protein
MFETSYGIIPTFIVYLYDSVSVKPPTSHETNGTIVFLLYVVFTPSPPSHHGSIWVLSVVSLLTL